VHFDPEDKRLLEVLSSFASAAYHSLVGSGALQPLLDLQFCPGTELDRKL